MRKLLILLPLLFFSCDLFEWDVEYSVTGSGGSFDVTISNKDDGTSQFDNVSSGWTYSFSTDDENHFLYVSAQNQSSSGSVTTKIFVDGDKKKSSTSNGAYVIASCSMTVSD
ncbi:MAG: MmpS family transport accessory protein [Candidatus Scalindua sp.]|jgi:hypothetical protein|nr:MmpS family transport accessory protein [Candidatus Scalindua sp.]|tara:strand:- start:39 stop:374 length:336 start_codon:yes stop_codon:yes gene_type:complete